MPHDPLDQIPLFGKRSEYGEAVELPVTVAAFTDGAVRCPACFRWWVGDPHRCVGFELVYLDQRNNPDPPPETPTLAQEDGLFYEWNGEIPTPAEEEELFYSRTNNPAPIEEEGKP